MKLLSMMCLLITLLLIPQISTARIVEEERVRIVVANEGKIVEKGILLYKMCIDGKLFLVTYSYGNARDNNVSTTAMNMSCTLPEERIVKDDTNSN